jgi:PAS domain S-box-containing protein
MNRTKNPSPAAGELRRRAEVRLRKKQGTQRSKAGDRRPAADIQRLLHELQVHQVELEMQNGELKEARDRMEALLEKYTDLYDFAPVGYFSLDEQTRIMEVNLTGAVLLGVERPRLFGRPLSWFVAPASRPVFLAFLEEVFAGSEQQVCEARLVRENGALFWANFHGTSGISVSGPKKWCRVSVSDITALKQAQEAQRRTEGLAVANRELRQEIVRGQAVEEALRASEQNQSRLLEQSRHMQEQLRHLSHQILQAQEEERKRISRELHDEITQTLVGISVHLETLAREATISPKALRQKIVRTQRLVEKSVNIVHRFSRELRPTGLDDLGLIPTLHSFLRDFMKRTGIRVHFTTFASGKIKELNTATRIVLYRVAQEALTNVARHARASLVEVNLEKLPNAMGLIIKDNGKSFDVDRVLHAKRNQRLGLIGMRERVEMVGGTLSVESAPGQGTTVRTQIPVGDGPARSRTDGASQTGSL